MNAISAGLAPFATGDDLAGAGRPAGATAIWGANFAPQRLRARAGCGAGLSPAGSHPKLNPVCCVMDSEQKCWEQDRGAGVGGNDRGIVGGGGGDRSGLAVDGDRIADDRKERRRSVYVTTGGRTTSRRVRQRG